MEKNLESLKNSVKNWWIYLIVGIISIGVGIYAIVNPLVTERIIGIVLAIYLILTGFFGVAFVISNKDYIALWGLKLLFPILIAAGGFILLFNKATSMIFVITLFGCIALTKAIETIVYAIQLSKIPGSKWGWTLAAGIILTILAIVLLVNPLLNLTFIAYMVGVALIAVGVSSIVLAFQFAQVKKTAKVINEAIDDAVEEAEKEIENKD